MSVLNSDRDVKIDKDKEQQKLEMEMQKRRERIEQWRAENKKKEIDALKKDMKAEVCFCVNNMIRDYLSKPLFPPTRLSVHAYVLPYVLPSVTKNFFRLNRLGITP